MRALRCLRRYIQFMLEELPAAQPLWMVLQAFGGEQHWDRYAAFSQLRACDPSTNLRKRVDDDRSNNSQPTARELRAMTYASIIAGARGIHYFILGALLPDYNEVSA